MEVYFLYLINGLLGLYILTRFLTNNPLETPKSRKHTKYLNTPPQDGQNISTRPILSHPLAKSKELSPFVKQSAVWSFVET
jgi:hypothetical protein